MPVNKPTNTKLITVDKVNYFQFISKIKPPTRSVTNPKSRRSLKILATKQVLKCKEFLVFKHSFEQCVHKILLVDFFLKQLNPFLIDTLYFFKH
jgi:hypothetical protein